MYNPNTYTPPGLYNPQNVPLVTNQPLVNKPNITVSRPSYVPMNPKININGTEYDTYRGSDGNYYYKVGGEYIKATEKEAKTIADNKDVTFLGENNLTNKPTETPENWADKAPEASTGGGSSDALLNQLFDRINKLDDDNAKLREQLNKPPEKHGAQFWADKIGLDYDLDAILQEYNDRTNTFYNELNANTELLSHFGGFLPPLLEKTYLNSGATFPGPCTLQTLNKFPE